MSGRILAILAATLLLQGCDRARGDVSAASAASQPAVRAEIPALQTVPASSTAPRRVTRTIDKDPDGDGIANRRVIITEVFDASGELVERIRERDFEADGIIDARDVTHFAGEAPRHP